jgi:molybdopterin converting factor small subunit
MSYLEERTSPTTLLIRVKPFGPLSERIPADAAVELQLPLPAAAIREELIAAYPVLVEQRFRIAVDARLPAEEDLITVAEEIALLPPFAGG